MIVEIYVYMELFLLHHQGLLRMYNFLTNVIFSLRHSPGLCYQERSSNGKQPANRLWSKWSYRQSIMSATSPDHPRKPSQLERKHLLCFLSLDMLRFVCVWERERTFKIHSLANLKQTFLRCTLWWIDTYVYCGMTAAIRLVDTSLTSHNCHFVFVVVIIERALKIYSVSNFQVYNIVLLTIVTVL